MLSVEVKVALDALEETELEEFALDLAELEDSEENAEL
jgi:hypothetical protein